MNKKLSSLALMAALAAPMVWADRAERAQRSSADAERLVTHVRPTDGARAFVRSQLRANGPGLRAAKAVNRNATAEKQAALPQAPGVTQINLFDSAREAYFVVTSTIAAGSTIQALILPPTYDGETAQDWSLDALKVNSDLTPGTSLRLPAIRTLGDFWKNGLTTYVVVVTDPGGNQTMSSTDFVTGGFYRNANDTTFMVPGIDSWREFVNGDGNTIVEIKGRFETGLRTEVVFEDVVSPQEAIQVVDSGTIQVNLNKVPNLDLTLMKSYLLTVGQDSWTDTSQFRHTPR